MAERDPEVTTPTDHPGESFTAWEDGHVVSAASPEVGWYLEPAGSNKRHWKLDPTGHITINPDDFDKAMAASWGFGDGAIEGLLSGLGKGTDMASMFIGGATGEISAATKTLRAQIIVRRNAWCVRHGIRIPNAALTFSDFVAEKLGKPEQGLLDALANLFKK